VYRHESGALVVLIHNCGTCIRSLKYPCSLQHNRYPNHTLSFPRFFSVKIGSLPCGTLNMRSHIAALFGFGSLAPALAAPGFIQQNTASVNTSRAGPSNTREVPLPYGTTAPLGGSGASSYHSPAFLPFGDVLGSQNSGWASPLGTLKVRHH
jgi:hypothetical protein